MKLVLASNNKDKIREIREILAPCGIEILSQREAGCDFEAEENGTTFEENARIKARAAMEHTGLPAVADDSGIEINALNGGPGIYSARYCGELSYWETCQKIIGIVNNSEDRGARFFCAVVCVFPNGDEICAEGTIEGTISYEQRGINGFGYDPILQPRGSDKTMAELTDEEKNAISHRGRAFRAFAEKLSAYLEKNKE